MTAPDVDIAEGHEVCDSCHDWLKQGEPYSEVPAGVVQWRPETHPEPMLAIWCTRCAPTQEAVLNLPEES